MADPAARALDGLPLFVYGTLMRGQANARYLAGVPCLGSTRTVAGFTLVWWQGYPGLRVGGATSVRGELYRITPALLAVLDEFEGHPTRYRRSEIALAGGGNAQAYLIPPGQAQGAVVIAGDDWRAARTAG